MAILARQSSFAAVLFGCCACHVGCTACDAAVEAGGRPPDGAEACRHAAF